MNWNSLDYGSFVSFLIQSFTVLHLRSCCRHFELKHFLPACVLQHKTYFPTSALMRDWMFSVYFPLFWTEVAIFSPSAKVTSSADFKAFTLKLWSSFLFLLVSVKNMNVSFIVSILKWQYDFKSTPMNFKHSYSSSP